MDCREFQSIHPALLDETLEPLDLVRAHRHLLECQKCADQDVSIRRALLVFRNLAPIEPSSQFADRLNRRLDAARKQTADGRSRRPFVSVAAVAAGLLLTLAVADNMRSPRTLSFPPVVAAVPEPPTSQFVTPTIAASMSAGFPVWPALMMAEHASLQLADAEYRFTTYTAR